MPIISRAGEFGSGVGYTTDEAIPFFDKTRTMKLLASAWYRTEDGGMDYPTEVPEPDYKHSDGKMYWTGRLLLSTLIPDGINATFRGNNQKETPMVVSKKTLIKTTVQRGVQGKEIKETVVILDGQIIQGTLDKTSFGEGGASIAPAFFYKFGYEEEVQANEEVHHAVYPYGICAHLHVGYSIGTGGLFITRFRCTRRN